MNTIYARNSLFRKDVLTYIHTCKNNRCHCLTPFLLCTRSSWCAVLCLVAQSCPTLCDPMDCSPPGSSIHGILQARILEQVTMPSSRASSQPKDRTQVSHIADGFFSIWATRGAFSGGAVVKESAYTAGNMGLIPVSGSSLGVGNSNLLQHSCLGNSMDRRGEGLKSMGLQRVGHDWACTQRINWARQPCDLSSVTFQKMVKQKFKLRLSDSRIYAQLWSTISCRSSLQKYRAGNDTIWKTFQQGQSTEAVDD